jgi:hypothetical protein
MPCRIVVRRIRLGVGVSVAVHAALAAIVFAYEGAPRPALALDPGLAVTAPAPAAPAVLDDDPPALEVAILSALPPALPPAPLLPPATARPAAAARREQPPAAAPTPAISAGASAPAETAAAADPGAAPRAHSYWFDLRRARVDLRIPLVLDPSSHLPPAALRGPAEPGLVDDLDRAPSHRRAAPAARLPGDLQPAGGGSYRSDQGVFTAHVAPDGTVKLTDAPNLRADLALPTAREIGDGIGRWYEPGRYPAPRGGPAPYPPVSGSIDAGDRSGTVIAPVGRGSFDLTDWLMRRRGQDPYARKKLLWLDATREARARLGAAHRAEQLRRTPELVQRNLDRVWQLVPDGPGRREALFELWDEAAEAGDAALVEAGRDARRAILGFIRARMPAGGPDAYTADELAALNHRRQAREAFTPYD